jgi:hypothetical protein
MKIKPILIIIANDSALNMRPSIQLEDKELKAREAIRTKTKVYDEK